MKAARRALTVVARLAGVVAAALPVTSCYLLNQGVSLMSYQASAEPVDTILRTGAYSDGSPITTDTRSFLEEVGRIREFAALQGLQASRNYSSIVPTDREYLADVVNATGSLSFERHEWWWPFVGRLPYKGFYDRSDAERLAQRLHRRGLDVWVRGVDAFSTLGILRDPLYEFMTRYDRYTIANLIMHEMAHATLFIRGHNQFNEEFATSVGDTGAALYLESIDAPDEEMQLVRDRAADRESARLLILDLRGQLERVYARGLDPETTLREKEEAIRAFQSRIGEEYDVHFRTEDYRGLETIPINNAFIDLYVNYTENLDLFRDLHARLGNSMSAFLEELSVLANPRRIDDRGLRRLARRDPKAYIRAAFLRGETPADDQALLDSGEVGSVE